jgi:hypothetical protein
MVVFSLCVAVDRSGNQPVQRRHIQAKSVLFDTATSADGANFVVFLDLGSGEHGFPRSSAKLYAEARRGSRRRAPDRFV